ncbi:MAG: ribosome maturation factor RimM [bacterium]|nr:ribosome maturation factor RimM [bacterium]
MANSYRNIAKVTKKIGKAGEVAIEPIGGLPFLLPEGMTVHLTPPILDGINHCTVESAELRGNTWVVKLSGSNSDTDAFSLVGRTCLVPCDELGDFEEEGDEAYDLIGLSVIDSAEGYLGEVVEVLLSSEQATLVVQRPEGEGGRELLIPFVDEFVKGIDDEAIAVDLPHDLLTLNG